MFSVLIGNLTRTELLCVSETVSGSVAMFGDTDIRSRRGYKTFFMLNSAEHEICPADKSQITNNCNFFLAKHR